VRVGGHLMGLRDIFGCYTEEWHPLIAGDTEEIQVGSARGQVSGWTEHIRVLPETTVVATFQSGDLAGLPAIVSNSLATSKAWYFGCTPDRTLMAELLDQICVESGVAPILVSLPVGVEVTKRINENGVFVFLLNHTNQTQRIEIGQQSTNLLDGNVYAGAVDLEAGLVKILKLN
jgi:beta-galactosidase